MALQFFMISVQDQGVAGRMNAHGLVALQWNPWFPMLCLCSVLKSRASITSTITITSGAPIVLVLSAAVLVIVIGF